MFARALIAIVESFTWLWSAPRYLSRNIIGGYLFDEIAGASFFDHLIVQKLVVTSLFDKKILLESVSVPIAK